MKMLDNGLKNYWVSWYHRTDYSPFETHNPWWLSGERVRDGAKTICAAFKAESESAAQKAVEAAYFEPPRSIEYRFIDEMPDGWNPFTTRFQRAYWME